MPKTDIGGRYVRRYYYNVIIVVNVRNKKHVKSPTYLSAGLQRMRASELAVAKTWKIRVQTYLKTQYTTQINWVV